MTVYAYFNFNLNLLWTSRMSWGAEWCIMEYLIRRSGEERFVEDSMVYPSASPVC